MNSTNFAQSVWPPLGDRSTARFAQPPFFTYFHLTHMREKVFTTSYKISRAALWMSKRLKQA